MKEAKERREAERLEKEAQKEVEKQRKEEMRAQREAERAMKSQDKEARKAQIEARRAERERQMALPPEQRDFSQLKKLAKVPKPKKMAKPKKPSSGLPKAPRLPQPKDEPELPGPPEVALVGRRIRIWFAALRKHFGGLVMGCNGHGQLSVKYDDAQVQMHLLTEER